MNIVILGAETILGKAFLEAGRAAPDVEPVAMDATGMLLADVNRMVQAIPDANVVVNCINDLDPAIHACWKAMVKDSDAFLRLLQRTPLTIDEWKRQREVYRRRHHADVDPLALGFATFYLNRTSRSGVLGAGVIGGFAQAGSYKIDARFDKDVLRGRIEKLAELSGKIRVTKQDGAARLRQYLPKDNVFAYVDPPYVEKGSSLYMSAFEEQDHIELARVLNGYSNTNWVLTYDVAGLIRSLYKARDVSEFRLLYSAHLRGSKNELRRPSARELIVLSNTVADALG